MPKEAMAEVEVTEEDTVDRRNWRKKIRCGDPSWEKPKEEEEEEDEVSKKLLVKNRVKQKQQHFVLRRDNCLVGLIPLPHSTFDVSPFISSAVVSSTRASSTRPSLI